MNFNRSFKNEAMKLSKKVKAKTAFNLACKELLYEALSLRKLQAGRFLKHINSLQIQSKNDFGEGCHTKGSEPLQLTSTAFSHVS